MLPVIFHTILQILLGCVFKYHVHCHPENENNVSFKIQVALLVDVCIYLHI